MPAPWIRATTVLWLLLALQLAHAQFPVDCPPVGLQNGAFESGQLAPWNDPANGPEIATLTVVSPGDQGPTSHALQIEFPAASLTSWTLVNNMGPQCNGGVYHTSFAINWVNFTALQGEPATNFCRVTVASSYCFPLPGAGDPVPYPGTYDALSTPGWQTHEFTCTAHKGGPGSAAFVLDIGCETTYVKPAFTWQVTDFSIALVGYLAPSSPSPTLSTPTPSPSQSYPSQSYPSQSSPTPTPSQSYLSQSYSSQSTPSQSAPSPSAPSPSTPSQSTPFQSTPSQSTPASTSPQSPPPQSTSTSSNSPSSIPSSVTSNSPTSLPSNTVSGTAEKTYQALGTSFLLGPVALIVLVSYLVY